MRGLRVLEDMSGVGQATRKHLAADAMLENQARELLGNELATAVRRRIVEAVGRNASSNESVDVQPRPQTITRRFASQYVALVNHSEVNVRHRGNLAGNTAPLLGRLFEHAELSAYQAQSTSNNLVVLAWLSLQVADMHCTM